MCSIKRLARTLQQIAIGITLPLVKKNLQRDLDTMIRSGSCNPWGELPCSATVRVEIWTKPLQKAGMS